MTLVSDSYDPAKAEQLFGMGSVLSHCKHVRLPSPRRNLPRALLPFERIAYTIRLARFANSLKKTTASLVLSTQSSVFSFPRKRLYHFVYEVNDLFCYPVPVSKGSRARGGLGKRFGFAIFRTLYRILAGSPEPDWFFVTGHGVLESLERMGRKNVSFFYPPARMLAVKVPKRKQILQACRIAPEKRLEFMFNVARKLPEYKFYLVGKRLPAHEEANPGYAERLLLDKPGNVEYIEALIRDKLDLLEESRVYFHSGLEKGILLILIEAMSAGAILVAPREGVAGEVVRAAGTGYEYDSIEDAVDKLRSAMDGESPWSPNEIGQNAKALGPKAFEDMIRRLVENPGESPSREPLPIARA